MLSKFFSTAQFSVSDLRLIAMSFSVSAPSSNAEAGPVVGVVGSTVYVGVLFSPDKLLFSEYFLGTR